MDCFYFYTIGMFLGLCQITVPLTPFALPDGTLIGLDFSPGHKVFLKQGGLSRFFLPGFLPVKNRLLPMGRAPIIIRAHFDGWTGPKGPPAPKPSINIMGGIHMKPDEEIVVKVTKEIVIKYIEIGRLALANFDEAFRSIYKTVKETVRSD
jgi:hypothetical protein